MWKVLRSGQVLMVWKLRFCLSLVSARRGDVLFPCKSVVDADEVEITLLFLLLTFKENVALM